MSDPVSQGAGEPIQPPIVERTGLRSQGRAITLASGLVLLVIMLVYLALAMAFSQVMPFNKGPDEGLNLAYIEFIAAQGRLPLSYEEREQVGPKANWPALYHLIVAGLSRLFGVDMTGPPHLKIFWDSFRYRAIDLQTENPWHLLTEDQAWPYYGRILALHLGRWLSIGFSLITLLLVYLTAWELLPNQPWPALTATALLAFIPQFIFVSAALNEDALVALLAALYFWLLIRLMKQPEKLWRYGALGLALGLSVTAKYTTVVLPLEVGAALAVMARQQGYGWRWWGGRLALVGGAAIAASAWWFGWNLWFLNEVEQLGLIPGLLRPLFTGGADVTLSRLGNFLSGGQIGLAGLPENTQVGTFPDWLRATLLSFWGVGIGEAIPLALYAYPLIALLSGAAGFGLWRLWRSEPPARKWLLLLACHSALFIILPLLRFGLSRRLGQTAQGRHLLIPAAAAIAGLLVWGLVAATPQRWRRWLFPLLIAGFVTWSGAHLYRLATFAPPLLPLRTLPQAAAWLAHPIETKFGDNIELVSYELDLQPEQGLLHLELAWRSLAYVNENYLLKLELLNRQGQVVSHWIGYTGQGRLPTLAWDPGDTIFDRLALPLSRLPPGDYSLQLQLLRDQQGQTSPLGQATLPLALAESVALPAAPAQTLAHLAYQLWRADGPATEALPTFRYPATISVVTDTPAAVELVDSTGQVWSPVAAGANISHFVIGPRWPGGNYHLQTALASGQKVTSEPILQVVNWWPRRFKTPEKIEVPLPANFANQLNFLGYTLPQHRVKAGAAFPLTLYWQALPNRSPQADFIQFNHLLDSAGTLRGGYDRRPLEYYSTLLWAPGEVVVDGYAVPVNPDAPPGQYYLSVGYYLTVGESAVNLPLVVEGQMTDVSSVTIGPIEVVGR